MLSADLVDLRKQEAAKNLTFNMNPFGTGITNGAYYDTKHKKNLPEGITIPKGKTFQFDPHSVDYNLPVGKVVGLDLYQVDQHPFHIHINPFQLTKNGIGVMKDWFKSGDWHDTLFVTDGNNGQTKYGPEDGLLQRVLMQTDFFTGPTVVHCHILEHEDDGMMVQVNFTGEEGSRYLPAYGVSIGSGELEREKCRVPGKCTPPLIDPTCYSSSKNVEHPYIITPSTCPPALPPPLGVIAFKVAMATAETNTWKVTAIVLGVVLAAVLLLVAAVFVLLAMRGTANGGAAAGGAEAGGAEMM